MPRARGTGDGRSELDVLLAELMEPDESDLRDPEVALRRVGRGDLSGVEREELAGRAAEQLEAFAWLDRVESIGAVSSGPAGVSERMRGRHAARALAWERVRAALG